tara:strand:+ start:304 stop:558 length:255 start_codon:yes stop_codon:yes gene_type:complete
MKNTTSWREELHDALEGDKLIFNTLSNEEMDIQFDEGYGRTMGMSFTAWSETRVYFPICYDGSEWVGSAPRNPCDEKTDHLGGG